MPEDAAALTSERVEEILRQVIDPELGINIVDLGLVRGISIEQEGTVHLQLTMTTPACPLRHYIMRQIVQHCAQAGCGIGGVRIQWVWDPPWTPEQMSPAARAQLRRPPAR